MRRVEDVHEVLGLIDQGLNDCEIARRSGVPRSTVREWRANRGRARARICASDASCPKCGAPRHDFSALVTVHYSYLLGLYLGDGCLSRHRGDVYRLRIVLDARYPGIIDECAAAMRSVMPDNRCGRVRCPGAFEVYAYSKQWPCLFPQHGPGVKHEREIYLADWQSYIVNNHPEPFLRGLIHSDGCRVVNTVRSKTGKTYSYPRYQFTNTSIDIRRIFTNACDRIGVNWAHMNTANISIARRADVAHLDEFIGSKA